MNPITTILGALRPAIDAFFRFREGEDSMEIKRAELELMKKKLEAEIELKLQEELRKPDAEFRQFVLDYEGRSGDQSPFMRSFRSSVRPVVTYWAIGILTLVMFSGEAGSVISQNLAALPEKFWLIFSLIFGFWFGGRAAMQLVDAWKEGEARKEQVRSQAEVEAARARAAGDQARADAELARARADQALAAATPKPAAQLDVPIDAFDPTFWQR